MYGPYHGYYHEHHHDDFRPHHQHFGHHGHCLSHHYSTTQEMIEELTARRDDLKAELERVEKLLQELS